MSELNWRGLRVIATDNKLSIMGREHKGETGGIDHTFPARIVSMYALDQNDVIVLCEDRSLWLVGGTRKWRLVTLTAVLNRITAMGPVTAGNVLENLVKTMGEPT